MDKYEIGRIIGEGQFGRVVQATTIATGTPVAIKQIDVPQPEALPHPVAREALLSTRLSHPHLVRTIEVFPSGRSLMIVMELCQTDLHHYLQHTPPTSCIPHGRTRLLIKMLLSALAFLHSNGILHRDVKPSNCLLDHFGMLKLGDFGLSRFVDEDMSHEVATRWYRAPELILGARNYDGSVDVWSAGCVFAELLRSRSGPIFCGDGDISQLSKIYDVLGTPDLHGMAPPETFMVQFESRNGCGLRRLLPCASDSAVSLLSALLQLDPRHRPTANAALMHPFFTSTDA